MVNWRVARRTPLKRSNKPIRRGPLNRGSKPKQRAPVKKRRSGGPRRGRVVDKDFLAWMGAQLCMISGKLATLHHVRFCGSPKNDRRTLPLAPEYHEIQFGPESIEALGKAKFEALHAVNIEAAIAAYNEQYEREHNDKSC